jgi:hypothetical protein
MRRSAPLVLTAALFAPLMAWSHSELTSPTPRSACVNATNCKTAPCGTIAAGSVTKTFFIGSSYNINWTETIEHPGNYRLALSTNAELGFNNFILQDLIPDTVGTAPHQYTWAWTVPDTANCDPCVLQLIQIMTDNPGTTYYNCADIQILPAGSTTPTPTPGPTATPTPSGNPNDPVEVDGYGSCAIGSSQTAAGFAATTILLGAALFVRRLRPRRTAA